MNLIGEYQRMYVVSRRPYCLYDADFGHERFRGFTSFAAARAVCTEDQQQPDTEAGRAILLRGLRPLFRDVKKYIDRHGTLQTIDNALVSVEQVYRATALFSFYNRAKAILRDDDDGLSAPYQLADEAALPDYLGAVTRGSRRTSGTA